MTQHNIPYKMGLEYIKGKDVIMSVCYIVGAGNFSEASIAFQKDDYIIAADGGLKYLQELGIDPDLVIGDMDSILSNVQIEQAKKKGTRVQLLPREKDDTDMLAAIRHGLEQGFRDFILFGALGGRIDHSIANIQCLVYLKTHGANGVIRDGKQCLEVICNEKKEFSSYYKGYFSAFCLGARAKHVTEKGLLYELSDATITGDFPIGVSNEFIGKESFIQVEDGMLLLCYPCFL